TGESDIRFFYDRISAAQELEIKPKIEHLVRLLLKSHDGPSKGKEPDKWSVEFSPLWQQSEKEIAETRKIVADTDKVYYDIGAVSAEDIARSRWKGDTYSPDMMIDFEERERLENIESSDTEIGDELATPNEVGSTSQDSGAASIQQLAFNGAQVSSLVAVVKSVALG